MKLSMLKLVSVAALVISPWQAPPALAQSASPHELKDDESVVVRRAGDSKLPARFNHDKPFLVSINRGIPDAQGIKSEIISLISRDGMLDKVLFDSFGSGPHANVEVKVGRRVPVEIAQAVIRALTSRANLPLTVHVYNDDSITQGSRRLFFAFTQRIVIGSLGERKGRPLSREKAEALLREGIKPKEFFRLLSEPG